MFSKSLMQFSVDGWSCVTSPLFTWGQTMVEVMKIMATSFKGPMHAMLHSMPPTHIGHHRPIPPRETPGHLQASLGQSLVGLLFLSTESWRTRGSTCALQETISQSCVSSGGSKVGLMATSSEKAYAISRSAAPRAVSPAAVHC